MLLQPWTLTVKASGPSKPPHCMTLHTSNFRFIDFFLNLRTSLTGTSSQNSSFFFSLHFLFLTSLIRATWLTYLTSCSLITPTILSLSFGTASCSSVMSDGTALKEIKSNKYNVVIRTSLVVEKVALEQNVLPVNSVVRSFSGLWPSYANFLLQLSSNPL